jgi:hypothetical protein
MRKMLLAALVAASMALGLVGCTGHGDWTAQEAWRYYSSQPQPQPEVRIPYNRPVFCSPDYVGGFVCQ